jgi:hypothetical protein
MRLIMNSSPKTLEILGFHEELMWKNSMIKLSRLIYCLLFIIYL